MTAIKLGLGIFFSSLLIVIVGCIAAAHDVEPDPIALGTFATDNLIVNTSSILHKDVTIGDITHQSLIDGPTLQSLVIPNTAYPYGEVNRLEVSGVVPAWPADLFMFVLRDSATADCTTHTQRSGAIAAEVTSTRTAGANDLTNVAIEALASGGQVNLAFEALTGDVQVDTGNLIVNGGYGFFAGPYLAALGVIYAESSGTIAIDVSGAPTNAIRTRAADTKFNIDNAAASTLTLYNATSGVFALAIGTDVASPNAPTGVNHGSLGTGSTNLVGNITGIGANTSVVLTYSVAFASRSWCIATTESGNQHINVTRSASAPTFSCLDNATGIAANCVDFTYQCWGQ